MRLLLIIVIIVIALLFIISVQKRVAVIGGGAQTSPSYLFSGYDGSYLWYLAELMQKDGARPANETGFIMHGEPGRATYLHKSLDNLYWFNYDTGPARGDFENVNQWPANVPNPAHKSHLYSLINGKPYAPKTAPISKFTYEVGKKYIAQSISSSATFRPTWSGRGITILSNEAEYNNLLDVHYKTMWEAKHHNPPATYETFIADLIPSKRIDNRAFVITMYVMLDGPSLRLCDHGFICMCGAPDDIIAVCLDESIVRVFPQEYPGDSAGVLSQMREIVRDCEQFFRAGAPKKNYKIYNMDILVDEDEKCWLLEFNSYFKFYDMLPTPPYSDAMRGIAEWTYKYGIKPRLYSKDN